MGQVASKLGKSWSWHSRQSLWLYFLTKTDKTLCASVKGQRHLPPVSDNAADTKKNLKNTALPVAFD